MISRRSVSVVLSAAALVATVGALDAAAAIRPPAVAPSPVIDDALAAALQRADAGAPLRVLVNADEIGSAITAVDDAGLQLLTTFDRVGIAVATGLPVQIQDVAAHRDVVRVEWADEPMTLDLDHSHEATRATQASEAFRTVDDLSYDGTGIGIMVIDSGADGTHPMFADGEGNSRIKRNLEALPLSGTVEPAVVDDLDGDNNTDDSGGHGTHVTSIAGGSAVTTGKGKVITGAAPGADLYVASTATGPSTLYGVSAALNWTLENHADPCAGVRDDCAPIRVVNNSYGGSAGQKFDPADSTVELQRALIADGVVVVRSSGNSGGDGSSSTVTGGYKIDPMPGVITVANYDDADSGNRDGTIASSSSRGAKAEPFTWPDIAAPGTNIEAACRAQHSACTPVYAEFDEDLDYSSLSGTSMAAPHIAGYVAVLLQADPGLTPAQIEFILEETAHRFGDAAGYSEIPRHYGDDQAAAAAAETDSTTMRSSHDRGAGLVDVAAALARVLGQTEPAVPVACTNTSVAYDAAGDAAVVAALTAEPIGEGMPTPDVDVLAATANEIPSTDGRVRVAIYVNDLGDPKGGGDAVRSFFTLGGVDFTLDMSRRAGAKANQDAPETSEAGYLVSGALSRPDPADPTGVQNITVDNTFPVVFDADNDVAYADLRIDDLTTGAGGSISGFRTLWRRSGGAVALPADELAATCLLTIGTSTDFLDRDDRIG